MNWTSTETFLFDTLTWSSMIIQCGTILWCMILSIGCQVIYKIQNNRLIENSRVKSNTSFIPKEEKGMKTFLYHHKSKRVVVEAAISTAPTLRMNIRRQYQKSSSISVPISQVFSLRRSFYGLTMCFFILILLGNASMATATIVSNSISKSRPSEWYIVLVSIPVLDKVLPLKNIAEELLFRGYRVGFALPENCRHWVMDLDRLEFISLGHLSVKSRSNTITSDNDYPPMDDILSKEGVYESYAASMRYYQSFQRPMLDVLVEDLEEDRPDLVILDRYTFAGFDACHALHIPYIVNSPMLLLDIDTPPAYIPATFSNFTILTTRIIDRCLNSIYRLRLRVVMVHLFEQVNAVRQEHGLPLIHSKHDLYGDTLILVNSVFGLDDARPIAPQFSMVGRLESARERNNQLFYEALPNEIQTWFTSTQKYMNPIILISFPWTTRLPLEVVTTLMKGLEFVNARVIWKVTLEEVMAVDLGTRQRSSVLFLSGYEDDLLLLNQLPISLLITAGDYTSIQDATSNGVPILGLPWTAEQWEAMNAIVRVGAGLALQSSEFTSSNILDATTLLLSTPSYSRAAFHVGELLKTGGGTKKAVNHIETVLEYGAYHTLPKTNLQPLYKTYLIDVYLVYSAILCGAAVILKTVFSVLYSIFEFAPDVHLGVTLDGSDDENPSNEECTRDVEYNNTSQSQNHRKEKSL